MDRGNTIAAIPAEERAQYDALHHSPLELMVVCMTMRAAVLLLLLVVPVLAGMMVVVVVVVVMVVVG